jgi:hypothetical protein
VPTRCSLKGKTVCDVGSRLGPVLYAGHLLSDAKRLVGVERNAWFCQLQVQSRPRPPPRVE